MKGDRLKCARCAGPVYVHNANPLHRIYECGICGYRTHKYSNLKEQPMQMQISSPDEYSTVLEGLESWLARVAACSPNNDGARTAHAWRDRVRELQDERDKAVKLLAEKTEVENKHKKKALKAMYLLNMVVENPVLFEATDFKKLVAGIVQDLKQ